MPLRRVQRQLQQRFRQLRSAEGIKLPRCEQTPAGKVLHFWRVRGHPANTAQAYNLGNKWASSRRNAAGGPAGDPIRRGVVALH